MKKDTSPTADTFSLSIQTLGVRGDGVGTWQDKAVYVPLTVPDDTVTVQVCGARGEGLMGQMTALTTASPHRQTPPCPHFGTCGGCAVQHVAPDFYATWKRGLVVEALRRAGLMVENRVRPLHQTAAGGRRRATLAALKMGKKLVLGFNERLSSRLVDLKVCPALRPDLVAILPPLRDLLSQILKDKQTLDVSLTATDSGIDILFTGRLPLDLAARESLTDFAVRHDIARLSLRARVGAETEPLAAMRPVMVNFGKTPVYLPAGAFLQPSVEGETALVSRVIEMVATAPTGPIADLFCGCGTFTLPLAQTGRAVQAVEYDAVAVRALQGASSLTRGVTPLRRDLDDNPLNTTELARFSAVVMDPPRAGAAAQARQLAASAVPVVVMVSCDPGTFARDARTLVDGGYELMDVHPVDQFVWSSHVEVVALFRRSPAV